MSENCERCKLVDELVCEKMLKIKELEFQLAEKQKENEKLRKQIDQLKNCGNCGNKDKCFGEGCLSHNKRDWQPKNEAI